MSGGTNGPLIYDGAPYQFEVKTLLQLRNSLMIRLGFAAQLASPPPGMTELLNDFLIDAQEQMYQRYSPLRNQIWWTINVIQGERHYDIPSISTGEIEVEFLDNDPLTDGIARNDAGSYINDGFTPGQVVTISGGANDGVSVTISSVQDSILFLADGSNVTAGTETVTITTVNYMSLNMRKITEQWVRDGSTWNIMRDGIPPHRFNETGQAYPQDYEWSDHLEIWPEPDKEYVIYVKGHWGLLPFAADTDVTTIDHKLVWLMSLANAKTHYGQKDAGTYFRQLEVFLKNLTAENHGNKRYIPEGNNGTVINKSRTLAKPEGTWR